MFNAFKIKLHSMMIARKPKSFVNPYAVEAPPVHPKLNPYISQYDTKKSKTLTELIVPDISITIPEIDMTPTFAHDMKEMFIGDLLWVAGKFKAKLPVKEKRMSYDEILRACENTKW